MRSFFSLALIACLATSACLADDTEEWDESQEWDDEEWSAPLAPLEEHLGDDWELPPDELEIDAVSAASEPTVLFVEIISHSDGDSVDSGFSLSAFGGPGWAIPEMELFVDGSKSLGMTGYNVVFATDGEMPEGEHTFRVQFTCVLESCAGDSASASVTLDVSASTSDPSDPTDPTDPNNPRDPNDPTDPDTPTDPNDPDAPPQNGFQAGGACAVGTTPTGDAAFLLLVLLFAYRRRR